MLCRSIACQGFENISKLLQGAEMAEIRLEKTQLSLLEVERLFRSHPNLIATCRPDGMSPAQQTELLKLAIDNGAKWVDIEIEAGDAYTKELVTHAKSKGCLVIVSYHNYKETPEIELLDELVIGAIEKGADLVKIATQVNQLSDNTRLMALYNQPFPILVIGMGNIGKITRVAALRLGAPFTFVSGEIGNETAPGQIQETIMKEILDNL